MHRDRGVVAAGEGGGEGLHSWTCREDMCRCDRVREKGKGQPKKAYEVWGSNPAQGVVEFTHIPSVVRSVR